MAQDPYKYFRVEARELAEQLGRGVLDLEKGPVSADAVAQLLRLAHTLKGAARVVKQGAIADAAHAIEDALAPFRAGAPAMPSEGVNRVLTLIDGISGRMQTLGQPAKTPDTAPERPGTEDLLRTVRADVSEVDGLLDGVAEAHAQLATLRRGFRNLERVRKLGTSLSAQLAVLQAKDGPLGDGPAMARMGAVTEELVSLLAGLDRGVSHGVEQIDRELRQVRDTAERLRLLPARLAFGSLERIARDTAHALGKQVRFEGIGGDVRLDTDVLAGVQGALVQLVRNAVAHGIESVSARRAVGKAPPGQVRVEVARRGRHAAFTCRDDGGGLDVDAIQRAAEQNGRLPVGAPSVAAAELFQLLLRGGISTSGAISEVSGRGVGLDVVREAAERLHGTVRVETSPGEGTLVELVVPVSLAAFDALIVEAAGTSAAIPLNAVRSTLRVAAADLARSPTGETLVYEGASIPFLPLEQVLAAGARESRRPTAWSTVVVRHDTVLVGVGVERLLGTAGVVVRPLPALAPADAIVAGAALDAAGHPQVVLDPEGLIERACRGGWQRPVARAAVAPILIVDDSLTTRMLEQGILEAAGYEVDLATSAEEALDKIRERPYALFLVDVEMPGLDGFGFVERTQADPALRHVPAILVTSRASPEDRARGRAVGAKAYVVKSEFDQADLLQRIRVLVGRQ